MPSFIAQLKAKLNEANWPVVAAALRQDAALWKKLQESDLGEKALAAAADDAARWSPGFLGLLTIEQVEIYDNLRAAPMGAVPEKPRYQAASVYEKLAAKNDEGSPSNPDLEEAAWLALALRERMRLAGSWALLNQDLSVASYSFWQLPLACLLGLLPDPKPPLKELLKSENAPELNQIAVHALLSNPLPTEEQAELLGEASEKLSVAQSLSILRMLNGRAALSQLFAQNVLARMPETAEKVEDLTQLERLLQKAELYQLSGQHDAAIPLLSFAWESAQHVQADLAAKMAESATLSGDPVTRMAVLEQVGRNENGEGNSKAVLANGQGMGEHTAPQALKGVKGNSPAALIAAAQVAAKNEDPQEAQAMAQAALEAIKEGQLPSTAASALAIQHELAKLLLDLELPVAAKEIAMLASEDNPDDAISPFHLSLAEQAIGDFAAALEAAHLAAALDPKQGDLQSHLAKSLQAAGEHHEAYKAWKRIAQLSAEASSETLQVLAECALLCEETQACIAACEEIIRRDDQNARAYQLMGKALLSEGSETGTGLLRRAIELDPELAAAWLDLAEYRYQENEPDKAIEVLLDAEKAVGTSIGILAALGKSYQKLGQNQAASEVLREAETLAETEKFESALLEEISLRLGQIEFALGHIREAGTTLAEAHATHPTNAEIAHLYGRVLLVLNRAEDALIVLNTARQVDPENLDLQLNSAQAHLAANTQIEQAQSLLANILALQPDNHEAKVLMAESHVALGEHNKARKGFEALLRSELGKEDKWSKRLALGKANAELLGGNKPEALSTLESLLKNYPEDLDVLRALCEAYRQAGRVEEAFQIAHKVYLRSAPENTILLWYAEQAEAAGKIEEAIQALSKAGKESEATSAAIIQLAKLHWKNGDSKTAKAEFSKLLTAKDITVGELQEAAHFLRKVGEAKEAVRFLQQAVELSAEPDASLFSSLSEAIAEGGQLPEALKVLEKGIQAAPHNPRYLVQKSVLLQNMRRPQAALVSLNQALELQPSDAELLGAKARLLLANQDWAEALTYAEKAVAEKPNDSELIRLAVELAAAHLQDQRAAALLSKAGAVGDELNLAVLHAELAFEAGESLQAAKLLEPALQYAEEQPRVLALQASMAYDHKDLTAAEQLYKQALKALGAFAGDDKGSEHYFDVLQGVAQAAILFKHWETAIELLTQLLAARPNDARGQLTLAKAYIERAEWQQLCMASQAIQQAPGGTALSEESYQASLAALDAAIKAAPFPDAQAELKRWQARAGLRFEPKEIPSEIHDSFPANETQAAALAFSARMRGDLSIVRELSQKFGSPSVLIELALALLEDEPGEALDAAKQAAKGANELAPMQAILAQIAKDLGEFDLARDSIQRALDLQPHEARWHALAAQLQDSAKDAPIAIQHFEQAIALEADYAPHHFAVGQLYLANGSFSAAVEALTKANQLEPNRADYLLALARAHQKAGELQEAEQNAKAAERFAPKSSEALLIQAEVALEVEQTQKASSLLEKVLAIDPKDESAQKLWAETLYAQGEYEKAIVVLERAQKEAEDPVALQIRRAQILPHSRGVGSDVAALKELSNSLPQRAEVSLALSIALAQSGSLEEAAQAAQSAMKQVEQLSTLEQARLHLHLGQVLKHIGQLDQSLHHLDQAAKLADHLAEVHLERGHVFLARRQYDQAMSAFEAAANAAPRDAEPHLQAALALKEAKDYAAAEEALRKAADLAPKDRGIQRQLAAVIALNLVHQSEQIGAET